MWEKLKTQRNKNRQTNKTFSVQTDKMGNYSCPGLECIPNLVTVPMVQYLKPSFTLLVLTEVEYKYYIQDKQIYTIINYN